MAAEGEKVLRHDPETTSRRGDRGIFARRAHGGDRHERAARSRQAVPADYGYSGGTPVMEAYAAALIAELAKQAALMAELYKAASTIGTGG